MQTQIFIHYFNPELLRAYGIDNTQQRSKTLLEKSIAVTKLAFIISEGPLLVPASSIFESPYFKEFIENIQPIIDIDFIKYISPTADIGLYAEKKIREFYNQPELYPNYTEKNNFSNFINLLDGIKWEPRAKSASKEISRQWEKEIETSTGLWKQIIIDDNLKSKSISKIETTIHSIPKNLDGKAFVLYNTKRLIPFVISDKNSIQVNFLINKAFVESYIHEYQASIISDSPIGTLDCNIKNSDENFQLVFSFRKIIELLKALGLNFIVSKAFDWELLVELKYDTYFNWFTKFLIENYKLDNFVSFKQSLLNRDFQKKRSTIINSKKTLVDKVKAICLLVNEYFGNIEFDKAKALILDNALQASKNKDIKLTKSNNNTQIIAITDAWGSNFGGINTLNFELCKSFAKDSSLKMICVLPYVPTNYYIDDNVHIIGLYKNEINSFMEGWELLLGNRLKENGFNLSDTKFCFGHDVITGNEALSLRIYNPSIKVIIVSHQAYQLYTAVKKNDGTAASRKGDEQLNLYKQADLLLCVGPLLYNHFKGKDQLNDLKIKNRIIEFIPGLPEVRTSKAELESFALMTMGRFEPENGDLKGITLVVESFALANKEAKQIFGDNPTLTIFGLSTTIEINNQQSSEIIKKISEISEIYIATNASPYTLDREALLDQVRNSSCVAMLSLQEGFGLVGWEAIACGIPVLISENTGLFKLLKKMKLENLVTHVTINRNTSDKHSVKEKIKEMASQPKISKDNAVKLLTVLRNDFTWDKVISKLLNDMKLLS